jgi:hypothetical protein
VTDRYPFNLLKRYADACDAYDLAVQRWRDDMNLDYQAAMNHAASAKQAAELEMRAAGRELRDRHAQGVAA